VRYNVVVDGRWNNFMGDSWMPTIQLPLTAAEFHRLPRNAAYKYELIDGKVYLSPNPCHYHAILRLRRMSVPRDVELRPITSEKVIELLPLFTAAFHRIQPYGSLDEGTRAQAAREALERTRSGGDGPWIAQASFVAYDGDRVVGAILVTLLPPKDPSDWDSYHWEEPPPADCIERRMGRPHLTWVFVSPLLAGRGIGTALLAAAGNALLGLGYKELLSTFMSGNDSSMLWHWRNGFRLLAHPGSRRRLAKRFGRR
jgi:GNAT superfamily N-acetyltransferase